ncbi:hypothetical protein ACKUB1_13035 [Methanospirillum stamsii]|uniref:MASE1 domain-containing protein n=1 Tax=Methanospirillum stamsii TaxID=1277351 RepID=A0A2V2N8L7_9EURY|nr:hypothetical protein [Methanospirillum stamsii]PWR76254.1 hypothetical protein DLD82_00120 [Methanospirillum stamsii]
MEQDFSCCSSPVLARPPFIIYLSLFFLLVCIQTLGARYFVFSYPVVPGVSAFYLIVAIMIVCALWFGVIGICAAYFGCVIGAGMLSGLPFSVSLYWSFADLWQVLIPYLAFRHFHVHTALISRRDIGIFIISCVIINNLIGAVWGAYTLEIGGIISHAQVAGTIFRWFVTNSVVCGILVPVLLVFVTPWMKTHELYLGVE